MGPCGACSEWLEKIQERSPGFYVLSYPDLDLSEVHERFLFWSVQEESVAPEDLGLWACRMCGTQNRPFSSSCRNCTVNRFSLEYNRIPSQQRFLTVLQALWNLRQASAQPATPEKIFGAAREAEVTSREQQTLTHGALLRTLERLEQNAQTDPQTGEEYGRLVSKDVQGRFVITSTGAKVVQAWNEYR